MEDIFYCMFHRGASAYFVRERVTSATNIHLASTAFATDAGDATFVSSGTLVDIGEVPPKTFFFFAASFFSLSSWRDVHMQICANFGTVCTRQV